MEHLFNCLQQRSAGILHHLTCLPSDQGIGCIDGNAKNFLNFLRAGKIKYWQVCPLSPTGYGDSPYQSLSSFAGNPYLIDLNYFVNEGLLSKEDTRPLAELSRDRVDFSKLNELFWPIIFSASENFLKKYKNLDEGFNKFKSSAKWLDPFCNFMALKEYFDKKPWYQWPAEFSSSSDLKKLPSEVIKLANIHKAIQYVFHKQFSDLRSYAQQNGIKLIGDIPIFPGLDSADVWANKQIFLFDDKNRPTQLAGVPPDYFSESGQLWGNPLYNWQVLKEINYKWWLDRLKRNLELYDVIRLDHFRGFYDFWAVPFGSETAKNGSWNAGPGVDFFKVIKKKFPKLECIAENLGELNKGVTDLLKTTGFPGMAVLQFAFSNFPQSTYLPHNQYQNNVMYTGTHDNNTLRGWVNSLGEIDKHNIRRYVKSDDNSLVWALLTEAYKSPCNTAIICTQDILGLDQNARLNTPGTQTNNWTWRMTEDQFFTLGKSAETLRELAEVYDR
ncbi:MAG: 4-alpha-glucanotransferase [Puniceicoccales bacterium]|jgi:4-alpha-glucanotransferase|nr:4-alpha-glucanotransferase [Puniceicoccales bacterium]